MATGIKTLPGSPKKGRRSPRYLASSVAKVAAKVKQLMGSCKCRVRDRVAELKQRRVQVSKYDDIEFQRPSITSIWDL